VAQAAFFKGRRETRADLYFLDSEETAPPGVLIVEAAGGRKLAFWPFRRMRRIARAPGDAPRHAHAYRCAGRVLVVADVQAISALERLAPPPRGGVLGMLGFRTPGSK